MQQSNLVSLSCINMKNRESNGLGSRSNKGRPSDVDLHKRKGKTRIDLYKIWIMYRTFRQRDEPQRYERSREREEVIDGGAELERFRISEHWQTQSEIKCMYLLVRFIKTERASQPQRPINKKPSPIVAP